MSNVHQSRRKSPPSPWMEDIKWHFHGRRTFLTYQAILTWPFADCNTEKRLLKNPEIAAAYSENITQYMEKGYICKIDPTEEKPTRRWYLPDFPIVRQDRATTKTHIILDASAKFGRISLSDIIYQGPKLQRDLNDVFL